MNGEPLAPVNLLRTAARVTFKAVSIARRHGVRALITRAFAKACRVARLWRERSAARRRWRRDLATPSRCSPVAITVAADPVLSIIVPITDAAPMAVTKILQSIARHASSGPAFEVIVVENGAPAPTRALLERCDGVRVMSNDAVRNFAECVNAAARLARGRCLQILGEHVIATDGWAAGLFAVLEADPNAAAVCSQIRGTDSRVYSAGMIALPDGRLIAYGEGASHTDSAVSYLRQIDACAAESFMVRADCLRAVGGLREEAENAPEAVADLCSRLREQGYSVLYQPESVVALTRRVKRRAASRDRASIESIARRAHVRGIVLVMDALVPRADRDAGSKRLITVMQLLREIGAHVIFVPHEGGEQEEAARELRRLGCEVRTHSGNPTDVLQALPPGLDAAWLSRPEVCMRYSMYVSGRLGAPVVYDTVDLHYLRLQREEAICGRPTGWQAMRDLELSLMRGAQCTVVTSDEEQRLLEMEGVQARVVPVFSQAPVCAKPLLQDRKQLLFIGNFTHTPNADALGVLAQDIMPRIRREIADVTLVVAGFDPNGEARRFENGAVRVLGHVANLDPVFARARVFVAPLRYGAGAKGKIVESFSHGVPVVTTPIGAEGLGLRDGSDCLVRSGADAFADAVLQTYRDDQLWRRLSEGALASASRFSPQAVRPVIETIFESVRKRGSSA